MDDEYKEYRRSKPQQKLYKPGSGPLRRSGYGLDIKMDTYEVENGPRGRNHYGSQNSVSDLDIIVTGREQTTVNSRQKKPEQQLYVPKSSDSSTDVSRSDNSSQYMNRRMSNKHDNRHGFGNSSGSARGAPRRDRSYAEYQNKDSTNNDVNYNRQYRQVSEPRAVSPPHGVPDQKKIERNRDSRSMETSAGRQGASATGGKPPSGRRNSAGYPSDSSRPKYMLNLENIPPRFRKKFLEQSGHHSFDNVDQNNKQFPNYSGQHNYNQGQLYNNNMSWSQTLPSRGRGRLRDNDNFDREKFMNSYLKNYEAQNSRRSTPSNSYQNLYEPNSTEDKNLNTKMANMEIQKSSHDHGPKNGITNVHHDVDFNHKEVEKSELDPQEDEALSHSSSNLLDMTNLDWTEEVEKNIKLDDMCDSSTSFSQNLPSSTSQEAKVNEPRESKRSGRTRRRDKRSSSRGQRNSEKKNERNRKDSNVSIQHDTVTSNQKQRERERRDSYKSNRSSTIGNSRDDLDHWRSLRSYSREQSTEGRIVSQCNSRDVSAHRALSPRDHDGFRVPAAVSKNAPGSSVHQKKSNGSWANGRTPSIERRHHSPAPSTASAADAPGESGGGGGRRSRKRTSRRKRNTENIAPPVNHPPGATPTTSTNWREEILESKKHTHDRHTENTHQRNRLNSVMSDKSISEASTSQPGLLILPQSSISQLPKDQGCRGGSIETQKTLYDHHNPSKPIVVQTSPTQVNMRMERGLAEMSTRSMGYEASDAARAARHRELLQQVDRADAILQTHALRGPISLADHWPEVAETRKILQNVLQKLLLSDLKYCQADNIEHNFWKILYYSFIEKLRRSLTQVTPEEKPKVVKLINIIIEEGNVYFENLVQVLEKTYKFNTDDYINDNHVVPPKGLGYVGLALISVQKLYVFLGDLTRYKEQVNESNNYAKSKFWYTKAQQINPKNGRPYNQLAILAIYARRKLDAVYYYMRSLMSSNPFQSARESLLSLFDENRKKYEAAERKRRAALEGSKATENGDIAGTGPGAHREVWIRPGGDRTTTVRNDVIDEHMAAMTSVELNKNFITSYLHVHGKLITKIGMETFHESASRMLCQFRALLHRQPLPTPGARLLQLTALNMFAVETVSTAKGASNAGERSAWLECALGVSLLMFGAMLERCCALLPEPSHTQSHADALLLLPAIKVWSDWMLCHSSVWNPPPSFDNFELGTESDPWDWLAKLMNILESLDDKTIQLESEMKEGGVAVRLAEDASLAGFTPLMYMEPAAAWARAVPHHAAEHALRTQKLLFFGTEYLVGVDPPVLRLEYPTNAPPRYVSAVKRIQTHHEPLRHLSEDSEDEDTASAAVSGPSSLGEGSLGSEGADEATKKLLRRKEQLESRKANLDRRRQRVQEIIRSVSVEVEVRPRWLVPDTNCFIDHLPLLQTVVAAPAQPYLLAVPLVVLTELEGLSKCTRVGPNASAALTWLTDASGVRFATSKGSILASRAFTAERDQTRTTNDDRVLATALNLHANIANEPEVREDNASSEPARSVRQVVLVTDDRNLRVKALAAELPARDLPSFVQWAGLTEQKTTPPPTGDKVIVNK